MAPERHIFRVKLKPRDVNRVAGSARNRNSLARVYGPSPKFSGAVFATSRWAITLCQALSRVYANGGNIVPVSLWPRATNWKVWIATASASAHSSTEKISECPDELRCCFHKGSASCKTPTSHQATTTTMRKGSSRRSCRARPNCRPSCKARARPGRASESAPEL